MCVRTATPEGQEMAQVLSTFTALEQSRFEAFRRCTFQSDAISKYIAHCLTRAEERRFVHSLGMNTNQQPRATTSQLHQPYPLPKRELKELVAPDNTLNRNSNPAQEITIVVTTLAKAYAQRLVTAARKVASTSEYPENEKLLSEHLCEARYQRVRQGLDPGFFMQPPQHFKKSGHASAGKMLSSRNGGYDPINGGVGTMSSDQYTMQLDAALAAQEAFDQLTGYKPDENENESEDEKKDNESEDESVSINSSEFYADDKVDADSVSSRINGNVKDDADHGSNEKDLEKDDVLEKMENDGHESTSENSETIGMDDS